MRRLPGRSVEALRRHRLPLTVAAGVTVLAGVVSALPTGDARKETADEPRQAVTVHVTAPQRIAQRAATIWRVAFGSRHGRHNPEPPAHVGKVTAEVSAGATPVRDVRVSVRGPGTLTPTTPTTFASLRPGKPTSVAWRWATPLRTTAPPYELRLEVIVSFSVAGERRTVTSRAEVPVTPPKPPTGDVSVAELPFTHVTSGYGPPERNRNNGEPPPGDGGPLRVDGTEYAEGLGLNARAVVGLHLGGRCERFTAVVGIDDAKGDAGTVAFRVVADGTTVFDSGTLTGASPAERIDLDVTGVRQLDLVSDPTKDGQAHDWADWARPRLSCGAEG